MPWKEVSIVSLRKEFVMLALQPGANRRELCRRFDISAKTGYKWLKRYVEEGEQGLSDQSRRPVSSPHHTPAHLEQAAVELRRKHHWGGRKLARRLKELGYTNIPKPSTFTRILHRHGLITPEASAHHRAFQRFVHPEPNDLWQMDFKGHFAIITGRCHPLTVLDDHSRFNLTLHACANEQGRTVKHALTETFRRYGLPEQMLLDNGAPWGSDTKHRLTPLTVWLMRLGIHVIHARPYHPQTLGKDERFHRTLNHELIKRHVFRDLRHCQRRFDWWRDVYNLERPHESLDMDVPTHHYRHSPRRFPESLPVIDYLSDDIIRMVQAQGRVHYRGGVYRIPKALRGQPVALRETQRSYLLDVYFCQTAVARIDLRKPNE